METRAELFRRVVEATRDGLWILDTDGRTSYANRRMADLVGRRPEEMAGLHASAVLDEGGRADLPRHLEYLVTAPDSDVGQDNVDARLVRPDGTEVWVLASVSPIRDEETGSRIGWLHRLTENTAQREVMESLRRREQLLAVAQSIAQIGSWEWDIASDTLTWSDQLYRIYNVTPDDFEATYAAFLDFIHPEDRPQVEDGVASVFSGADAFEYDVRVIPRGGQVRWVRSLGRVERGPDGQPVTMGGTAQDITDRVRADLAAAESTRRLYLLEAMATAANQTNGLAEAIELAAVGLPAYTSWKPVGVVRRGADGSLEVDTATAAEGWADAADTRLAEQSWQSREVGHAPLAGHETTHSLVALPVLLDGEVTCVIELLADEVPPDQHSQVLLTQISQQLSQVAQREVVNLRLAQARDEAMEASRLKSEFLATMSHEIRTPMNGVIGLNDLLLLTDLDPHQRRLAEGLQSAGLTLLGIINDILDFSKIEAGKVELEEFDFDVRPVFDKTADVLSGPAFEKGIELVVSCHPDVPAYLRGDPGRLGQVVTNLASNAVKFTESGEVAIRASVASETDERVVLRVDVSDTGIGIDPQLRPHLFDAFTQADPSTTREYGGTGLGLAISDQLVAALGGELTVDSEVGRGSTFTFTAALGRGHAPPRRPHDPDPGVLRGLRVLVVDDNVTNRLILDEQLRAWGLTPVLAGTSEEAMTAVRAAVADGEPFDVAILDLLLPDGDGLALARAITAGAPDPTPRMLLLSSVQHVDMEAVRGAGIDANLTKPVHESQLLQSLVDAVRNGEPEEGGAGQDAAHGPAPERRILVVEDNEVNQMVAVGLLENAGYAVDVVADGVAAVEAVHPGHGYAAVLMDCRMPRLDGYGATRAIRASEPAGQRVPIIAMTASALESERERCLEAGMDDFLTKPVDALRMVRLVTIGPTGPLRPRPRRGRPWRRSRTRTRPPTDGSTWSGCGCSTSCAATARASSTGPPRTSPPTPPSIS
jgi:hypothetical protein